MTARWRVLIVDEDEPSRIALARALAATGGLVVGEAASIADALALAEGQAPDVAIVGAAGAAGDASLAAAWPCALVLHADHPDPDLVARAARAGVVGFLPRAPGLEALEPTLELAIACWRTLDAGRRERAALGASFEARRLVERAKGVLIERLGVSEAEAHRRLQKAAMDTRRPMAAVARALLTAREPGPPRRAG